MHMMKASMAASVLLVALSGCSSTPERHSGVERLRSDYNTLAAQSHVQQNAAQQLDHAEDAVERAETAVDRGLGEGAIEHYVYLADRRLAIVEEAAKLARAEEIVQNAEAERQDIVLERRQEEATQAESRANLAEARADRLEQSLTELERELDSLQAEEREENIVLTLQDPLFLTGEAELLPEAEQTLNAVANFLERYQDHQLEVRGHSDSSGSPGENQRLSESRARLIEQELVERGIDRHRIQAEGYGADDPVATNQTFSGREQNRRVEIVIEDAGRDRISTR